MELWKMRSLMICHLQAGGPESQWYSCGSNLKAQKLGADGIIPDPSLKA